MMIGRGWAFVHNPKTGGQAIRRALGAPKVGHRHAPRSELKYSGLFTFGFVRDPWERLLSLFLFMCRTEARQWPDRGYWIRAGFKAWLLEGHHSNVSVEGLAPLQRRPQTWWLDGCDFVGRFERLDQDFEAVCLRIGQEPQPLPQLNGEGEAPSPAEVYDEEMSAAVVEWFAPDIERWGYGAQ